MDPGRRRDGLRLRRILEPLAPFRSQLMPIWGIAHESAEQLGGEGHRRGGTSSLTGAQFETSNGGRLTAASATSMSLDQIVADIVGASNRLRSLELGISAGNGLSWRARDQTLPITHDSGAVWDRVFGEVTAPGEDAEAQRRVRLRRSLLSHQQEAIGRLQRALPASDRPRLEQHLTHVRDLEMRLSVIPAQTTCAPPERKELVNLNAERLRINTDLTVAALACGATSVVSTAWAPPWPHYWPHLYPEDDHLLSHEYPTPGSVPFEKLVSRCRWQAEEMAYLLGRLRDIPEGDGTMLDNTLVMWTNDMHTGWHTHRDIPILLAGNVKGSDGQPYFNSGRFLRYETGTTVNRLLLTLANAYGANLTAFGDRDFSGPELDGLRR